MSHRPPISPLFPYTTLFRSARQRDQQQREQVQKQNEADAPLRSFDFLPSANRLKNQQQCFDHGTSVLSANTLDDNKIQAAINIFMNRPRQSTTRGSPLARTAG